MERIKQAHKKDFADIIIDRGSKIISCAGYFICSFMLSGASLFGIRLPLAAALVASSSSSELVFAAAGGIAGAFLRLGASHAINGAACIAGAAALIFVTEKLRIVHRRKLLLSVGTGFICFAASAVMLAAETNASAAAGISLCVGALCGSCVVFYSGANDCIVKKKRFSEFDSHSLICITVSLCTILPGISEISFYGFRPAGFFGSFVIICAAIFFGASGACVAGTSMGACLAVSGTSSVLSLCFGICGLVSGTVSKYGCVACGAVFSLTAGIFALIDGTEQGVAMFAEAAAAAFAAALIPKRKITSLREDIIHTKEQRISVEYSSTKENINLAADAIASVSACIQSVSKGIDSLAPAKDLLVCMRVKERICADCKLKGSLCPERGEFDDIIKKLHSGKKISAEDFSVNFSSKCPCTPRLADCFNRIYATQNAVTALQAASSRNRELACGQYEWTAKLLKELSSKAENDGVYFHLKERTANRVLNEFDMNPVSVRCRRLDSGGINLICTVDDIPRQTSLSHLTATLSRELGIQLTAPRITESRNGKELSFSRRELFQVHPGSAFATCGNKRLCGDYFECFRAGSKAYIVMSDGMGTGGRAAVDSAMTVELFSRLLKAGLSPEISLSITNSALAVKSDDESISTLDIAQIDLFTGDGVIYKAGAAQSFYTCSGRVKAIEMPSAPLGILPEASFSKYTLKIRGGDKIVMVSDGILGLGFSWIQDEIRACEDLSACELAETILARARKKCGEKYDDMTVVACTISEK